MGRMSDRGVSWPGDYENTVLVLEPRNTGNVGYYFADHTKQVVFWLDECDVVWDTKEVKVELKPSHIGKHSENIRFLMRAHSRFRSFNSILLLVTLFNQIITISYSCTQYNTGSTTSYFRTLTNSLPLSLMKFLTL